MNTQFEIILKPYGIIKPIVSYTIGDQFKTLILSDVTALAIDYNSAPGPQKFVLNFNNKTNETLDMAIEIVSVSFEGMTLDRFKWSSKYYPIYPEPWASQQAEPLPDYHSSATYMGWNGCWELEFETPIFRWIHQLENLGWIYD